jgi:death-on-curing protein
MKRRTLAQEPHWLSEAALLAIHAQQIERYGGAHGVLDPAAALAALDAPKRLWQTQPKTDFADLAATYLVGFTAGRAFRDGNRRLGPACALVFLSLNGLAAYVEPRELLALTLFVARQQGDAAMVAAWYRA